MSELSGPPRRFEVYTVAVVIVVKINQISLQFLRSQHNFNGDFEAPPPTELLLCTALILDIPAWLTTYLIRLNASVPTPRRSPGIVNVSNDSRHALDPALVCEEEKCEPAESEFWRWRTGPRSLWAGVDSQKKPAWCFSALCGKDGDKWLFSFTPLFCGLLFGVSRTAKPTCICFSFSFFCVRSRCRRTVIALEAAVCRYRQTQAAICL